MGICSGISMKWLFIYCFQIELEFSLSVDFCGGRKTGEPRENLSEQGQEPTTNSTHIQYDAGSGNQTWAKLVGGERSHRQFGHFQFSVKGIMQLVLVLLWFDIR